MEGAGHSACGSWGLHGCSSLENRPKHIVLGPLLTAAPAQSQQDPLQPQTPQSSRPVGIEGLGSGDRPNQPSVPPGCSGTQRGPSVSLGFPSPYSALPDSFPARWPGRLPLSPQSDMTSSRATGPRPSARSLPSCSLWEPRRVSRCFSHTCPHGTISSLSLGTRARLSFLPRPFLVPRSSFLPTSIIPHTWCWELVLF